MLPVQCLTTLEKIQAFSGTALDLNSGPKYRMTLQVTGLLLEVMSCRLLVKWTKHCITDV